jgi:hypothetical protein
MLEKPGASEKEKVNHRPGRGIGALVRHEEHGPGERLFEQRHAT